MLFFAITEAMLGIDERVERPKGGIFVSICVVQYVPLSPGDTGDSQSVV